MNILFLDIETTGTDEFKHATVEIAAQLHIDGQIINQFNERFYDRQTSAVSLQALKYNNLKITDLVGFKHEAEGVMAFVDWLLGLKVSGPIIVCGHNVPFDLKFIKILLAKYNITNIDDVMGYKIQDTCVIGMFLVENGKLKTENNKTTLEALAKGLGIDVSKYTLHRAKDDVALTAEVYYALGKLVKGA